LISTARFKAIDTLRRRARFDASQAELVRYLEAQASSAEGSNEEDSVEDDRLRLIFTCCHPSLPPEARIALILREVCGLTTEAAIAAVHAGAESVAQTDWRQIVALYNRLARIQPSPVVQLNRAVAIAMCDGPEAGLAHIDAVLERCSGKQGDLANYYLAHSARADMYRRLGRTAEARASYEKALALTQQEPERQFLQDRIRQLK
jgi:predicted RNA polymerase sigma factor